MTDDRFPTEVRVVFGRNEYLYRDYHIYFDPPPIPIRSCDWHWSHDDFDGADDADDHRYGHSASLEDAKADIDAQIQDLENEAAFIRANRPYRRPVKEGVDE